MQEATRTDPVGPARSWLERWSPIGGILYVAGFLIIFAGSGDSGETPADFVEYAQDKHDWLVVSSVVALVAVLFLIWFVAGLAARVRRVGDAASAAAVSIGGAAFIAMSTTAIMVWTAPALDLEGDSGRALAQAEAYLTMDDFGWMMLGAAGVAIGAMAIAASLVALRSRTVPAWLGWVGVVLGVASLATVAFLGMFAWLVWILVASILMLWKPDRW